MSYNVIKIKLRERSKCPSWLQNYGGGVEKYQDYQNTKNTIKTEKEKKTMKKFTMCVGLLDKDTKQQEINTLDAFKVASNVFAQTTGGATITEGRGVYTHNDGTIVIEPTLVCVVYGGEMQDIKKAADALKVALNQESVAIEETESNSIFY